MESNTLQETEIHNLPLHCTECDNDFVDLSEHPCFKNSSGVVQIQIQAGIQLVSPYVDNSKIEESTNDGRVYSEAEGGSKHWNRDETLALIAAYGQHVDEFNNPLLRQYTIWKKIEMELQAMQIQVTMFQCMNKWKSLLRGYRKLRSCPKLQRGKMRFAYVKEMNELLKGKNISSLRVSSCASPSKSAVSESTKQNVTIEAKEGSGSSSDEEEVPPSSKKRKEDDFFSFLKEYFTEKRKRMIREANLKEERHKKKMELEQRKLELLKALLQK